MVDKDKKKILIVGCSAKEYSLAKRLKNNDSVEEVFVAPGNDLISEVATCIDIRENDPKNLLEFVLEHDIYLTIASSSVAIKSDIAGLFQANDQLIFAPSEGSSNFAINRGLAKKFLYRLHIPTPKFGIFDKEQLAIDYIRNSKMPIIVGSDENSDTIPSNVCATIQDAKNCVGDIFKSDNPKVVIEDYTYGSGFTFYVITDGYNVLPITTVRDYKFLENGDGGLYTLGIGAFAPDYRISPECQAKLIDLTGQILDSLEKKGTPYMGILGIEGVLTGEDDFILTSFCPFFKDHDIDAVLNLVDEDLFRLFEGCAVGSFADEYEQINLNGLSSVSSVVYSRKSGVNFRLPDFDDDGFSVTLFDIKKNEYLEYVSRLGRNFVLTKTSSTLSRAKKILAENIELVKFEGKKYRSDICK